VKSCDREEMVSLWWCMFGVHHRSCESCLTDESWCDESVYECLGEVR
jgi:hypothetical protein